MFKTTDLYDVLFVDGEYIYADEDAVIISKDAIV